MTKQEEKELITVITDFLEMGHVENIISMFKHEPSYYKLTGQLIQDQRFLVRIGIAVLFEELKIIRPNDLPLAIPSLIPLLSSHTAHIKGEAAHLLGIIGTKEALEKIAHLQNDPDLQVREIVGDFLPTD